MLAAETALMCRIVLGAESRATPRPVADVVGRELVS
jgi:hypothetical protein